MEPALPVIAILGQLGGTTRYTWKLLLSGDAPQYADQLSGTVSR